MPSLITSPVSEILEREHTAAKEQRKGWAGAGGRRPAGNTVVDFRTSERHRTSYLSIGPAQGRWMYGMILAKGAQEIVEFGSSFGISTLYLAAAAARTGGRVTGSEYHPEKAEKARENLRDAGLKATILTGDARETLAGDGPVIDFLFLDGAKELYLPVLDLLLPRLAAGSIVVADNIPLDREEQGSGPTAEFNSFVATERGQFVSSVVGFGRGGMSFSVLV